MKIYSILLAIILLISVVSSTTIITTIYHDKECTQEVTGTQQTIDVKSGECSGAGKDHAGISWRYKNKGDKLEICEFSFSGNCKGNSQCEELTNGECVAIGGVYRKHDFFGSSSSVAISSLFVVAAAFVLAF